MAKTQRSVWTRPAWITAIVALVSVVSQFPSVVSDYLSNRTAIKLEEQKIDTIKIQNTISSQEQEFRIIFNTLEQQGTERIVMLRYLAETHDDEATKNWAKNEVRRLSELVNQQEKLEEARRRFAAKEQELRTLIEAGEKDTSSLRSELAKLEQSLSEKKAEVSELRQQAGVITMTGASAQRFVKVYRIVPDERDLSTSDGQSQALILRTFMTVSDDEERQGRATMIDQHTCRKSATPCVAVINGVTSHLSIQSLRFVPRVEVYKLDLANPAKTLHYVPDCKPVTNDDTAFVCILDVGFLPSEPTTS